ncbi:hypothetical protein VZT92_013824 [Zoarces viviparus]|uniref:Alpha-D-phosphohexomutase C-terminal domain-containing protein n=1 Tax=Zoarces viviparus TaxID=48416 RepID=A0AAW1F5P1_ZOAVI
MITFTLQNGVVATLRTSGTEPKIKCYTEYCAAPGTRSAAVHRAPSTEYCWFQSTTLKYTCSFWSRGVVLVPLHRSSIYL